MRNSLRQLALILTFVALLCLGGVSGVFAQSAGPTALTGSQCLSVNVFTAGPVVITVAGSWSGVLQAQSSGLNVPVTALGISAAQQTITANGIYTTNVFPANFFQVCARNITGTATVTFSPPQQSNAAGTITGTQCLSLNVYIPGLSVITLSGSWSGSIQPKVYLDPPRNGTVTPLGQSAPLNIIIGNGTYTTFVTAPTVLQVCGASLTGTASVAMFSASGSITALGGCIATASTLSSKCGTALGTLASIIDGSTSSDCTVGGGLNENACIYNGTAWVAISGSGGSGLPSGFVDASTGTGADICAKITSLIAAGNYSIYIPKGNFAACAGSGGIGVSISVNSVTIQGAGSCNQLISPTCGATTVNLAAGVTGFDITGSNTTLHDFNLVSADTGANTDDGIRNRGGNTTIDRLSIYHFGRSGLLTLGNSPTTADTWHYTLIQSYLNYGDGFQWGTPCTDNHLGIGTLMTASVNGGWGFNILCGNDNLFQSPQVQLNSGGGYHVANSENTFTNVYAEAGTGSSFIIDSGVVDTYVWFNAFGQPSTVTNNGGANEIHFYSAINQNAQNQLVLAPLPGATSPVSYLFTSGSFANSDFGMYDATNGAFLLTYDPTTFWTFKKNVTIPNLTISGTCTGCGGGIVFPQTVSGTTTAGHFPYFSNATTLSNNSNLDDGATLANTLSYAGSGGVSAAKYSTTATNGGMTFTEGTCANVTPAIGLIILCAESTSGPLGVDALVQNIDNAGWTFIGATPAGSSGDLQMKNVSGAFSASHLNDNATDIVSTEPIHLPLGSHTDAALTLSPTVNWGMYDPAGFAECFEGGGDTCDIYLTDTGLVSIASSGVYGIANSTTNSETPDTGWSRLAAGMWEAGNGTQGNEAAQVRLGTNTCRITADVNLTVNTANSFCSWSLPNISKSWAWQCSILWTISAGSGTNTFSLGVNSSTTPASTTNAAATIYTTQTGTQTQGTTALSASGALNVLTSPTYTPAATIEQALASGTIVGNSGASGTFAVTATAAGTTATAAIKAGSVCVFQ